MSCPGNNYVVPGADPCAGGGGGGSVTSVNPGTKISITGPATDPIVNNDGVGSLNTLTGNVTLFSNNLVITPGVPTTDQITIDSTGAPVSIVYTTSGTYVTPVGAKFCDILMCGGGGGGGGAQGSAVGGGGASGATNLFKGIMVNGGFSEFVMTIGIGGSAGGNGATIPPASNGGPGGTTSMFLNDTNFVFNPPSVGGGGGFMLGVGGSGGDYGGGGGTWGAGSFGAGGTGIKGNGTAGNIVPGLGGRGGGNVQPTTGAGGAGGTQGGFNAFAPSLGGGGCGGTTAIPAQSGGSGFVAITYYL